MLPSFLLAVCASAACAFALAACVRDYRVTRRLATGEASGLAVPGRPSAVLDTGERRALRNELALEIDRELGRHALSARLGWRICVAVAALVGISFVWGHFWLSWGLLTGAVLSAVTCGALGAAATRQRTAARALWRRRLDRFQGSGTLD
jgi:hypothetical protein